MANTTTKTLFLPGAGGSALFWRPVADVLAVDELLFAWPGLGNEPATPDVDGLGDLVAIVLDSMTEPVNIVAQSMGGFVAIKAALAAPDMVNRLVLTATSAGCLSLTLVVWTGEQSTMKLIHTRRVGSPTQARICRTSFRRSRQRRCCFGAIVTPSVP